VVVKAQVLTGGRGKAGGVKLADDPDDAEHKAEEILGLDINGHVVRKLWIEDASEIAKEYYLSVTFDRGVKKSLFMLTTEGGVEIEEVAEHSPDALSRLHVDPLEGYQPYQARRLIYGAGIDDPNEQKQLLDIIGKLYRCFVESDAMLCEINPLIVTPEGEVRALDSVIALAGGRPAYFCDLGGGGDAQGVVDALEVITADPQVKSIFFNIFGGITRGDEVARGILQALDQLTIAQPIVVRLDGTNAEEGREILAEAAPPNLHTEATMLDAARRAVELAR
jgi:succinyl-CoA synthetase beta subunit